MPALQTRERTSYPPRETAARKRPKARWFWLLWIILIALGTAGTYTYINHMQKEMVAQLQADTEKEMTALMTEYNNRFTELSKQMSELESKVQSFNELLTFTKDQASGKTDNSNQLYSQLNEVKKQLSKLEKKMELIE